MIETLDGQAIEVEVRRHATRPVVGFQNFDIIALLCCLVSGGKPHRTRTDDKNFGLLIGHGD